MFTVEYSKEARKVLKSLPADTARIIREKIEHLAVDTFAVNNNVKKLSGRPGYRLRVGDWRVIYEIQDQRVVILVLAIGPRGGVYQ